MQKITFSVKRRLDFYEIIGLDVWIRVPEVQWGQLLSTHSSPLSFYFFDILLLDLLVCRKGRASTIYL